MDPKIKRALKTFDAHEFVRKHGGYKETPSIHTYEYLLPCPRCGSNRLRWNNRKNTFICWGCKMTGDTLFLIQIMEKCDELGAFDYLMDGYVGGDAKIDKLEDIIGTVATPVTTKARKLPPMPWPQGVELLTSPCAPHERAWAYLRGRGVPDQLVASWKLGYGRSGRLEGYVVFPCWINGALAYWQGRATWDPPAGISSDQRKAWEKQTGYRKTLNPTSHGSFATAGEVLFGYDQSRQQTHIIVTEGPFDAIKVGVGAVALLGKVITPAKLDRLMRTSAQRYTVYLDRGEEEAASAENIASQLSAFGEVFIAVPPEGHDPGSLTPEQNAEIIGKAERFRPGRLTSILQA